MGTKTEEYLRILAEGGDAPADCCMTNEQKLIAEATERVNGLEDELHEVAKGANLILLDDYLDMTTGTLSNVDYIRQAVEDGKVFYWNVPDEYGGDLVDAIFHGKIVGNNIVIFGNSDLVERAGGEEYALWQYVFAFDKETGEMDATQMSAEMFVLKVVGNAGSAKILGLPTLSIEVNGTTYEYNGTQDVSIVL